MKLNDLPKTTTKSKKRVGRGYGSGKGGHTSGRGMKGQKSRSKLPLYFEGTAMRKSFIRRVPMLRGKFKNISFQSKKVVVNLKDLKDFKSKSKVNIKTLAKAGLVDEKEAKKLGVKILGDGEIKKALTVELPTSKSAQKKIEKAGGKVVEPSTAKRKPTTANRKQSTGKQKKTKKTSPASSKATRGKKKVTSDKKQEKKKTTKTKKPSPSKSSAKSTKKTNKKSKRKKKS